MNVSVSIMANGIGRGKNDRKHTIAFPQCIAYNKIFCTGCHMGC